MSHIDEGELTAYADGAYPPEDADGQRIAAHIAECANCRNRLAQAQMLSGRASEILAVAAPASMDAPPFEQIVASVPRRAHARRRMVPLSWAASIVLAAGLGWFGRDALYEPEAGLRMAQPESATELSLPVAAPAPVGAGAGASAGASAGAGAGDRARDLGVIAGARADAQLGSVAAGNAASTEVAQDAVAQRSVTVHAPMPQPRQEDERAVAGASTGGAVAAAPAPPPSPSPSAPPSAVAKSLRSQQGAAEAADLAVTGTIRYITPAQAEERKLALHIVPELEIVRIGLTDAGIQVEQKLPDGKIVTLTSERTVAANEFAASARKAKAGRNEAVAPVVVVRDGVNVTISGALPADSLRALGAKIP